MTVILYSRRYTLITNPWRPQYLRERATAATTNIKYVREIDGQIYLYKIDADVTAGHHPAPRPNDIVAFNWRKVFAIAPMAQSSRCDGDVYAGSWGQRVEAGKQEGVDVSGINLVWRCGAVFGPCRGVAGGKDGDAASEKCRQR